MGKQTTVIAIAQLLATSLWFSANVAGGSAEVLGALTTAVQAGFILGTLAFSFGGLADRFAPSKVFALSACLGALCNLLFVLSPTLALQLACRVMVGVALAGVYPIGMKMAVAWAPGRAGQTLGLVVGMLTLGTALPLGVRSLGGEGEWRAAVLISSLLAVAAAVMVLRLGDAPAPVAAARPDPGSFFRAFKLPKFRATAFAYFGHMWELYAFWTLVPLLVAGALTGAEAGGAAAGAAGAPSHVWALSWAVIAVGAIGCFFGGALSRGLGSERVAGASLTISGAMCLVYPFLAEAPPSVRLLALLIWGAAVIADSPQFSALAARHCPPALVGSSLALQTSIGFAVTIVSILVATRVYPLIGDKVAWLLLPGPILGLIALRAIWFTPFEEILPPLAPTAAAVAEARAGRVLWYRQKAMEVRERARKAEDRETREGLVRVAEHWDRLAEEAQRE